MEIKTMYKIGAAIAGTVLAIGVTVVGRKEHHKKTADDAIECKVDEVIESLEENK